MVDSIINTSNIVDSDLVYILANYDKTSSFGKGSDKGPKAIIGCLDRQVELFDRISGYSPSEERKISCYDLGDQNSLSPEQMVKQIKDAYSNIGSAFPFLIGGEHSVTHGPIEYFSDKSDQITILQLDAHADLREDDSDYNDQPWGRYAHSTVMKRALDAGYKIVQVGIRAYSKEEATHFSNKNVTVFEGSDNYPRPAEVISAISTDLVYITIDVDGFDPSVMPATGTPVTGGFDWYYAVELLKQVTRSKKIIGADLVEVAPVPHSSITEYTAAQLCYSLAGLILMNS